MGIAVVVWWGMVEKLEPKAKKMIPWVLLAALVGARVYHVIDEWAYYSQDWSRVGQVWNGGLSIWGAIGGGMLVAWGLGLQNWAALVTPLPLAQAIGRIANGINGEFTNPVLGVPWWGMEAILDLLLFGVVWKVRREWRTGVYLVGYLLIRLALQPYR